MSDGERASAIAALAATGPRGFSWLDGGPSAAGWLAVDPDVEVEADDLAVLDDVEAMWRAAPEHPWFGWLTYDLGAAALLERRPPRGRLPGLGLRRYPAALRLEPGGAMRPVGDAETAAALRTRLGATAAIEAGWPWTPLRAQRPAAAYRTMIVRGLEHIAAGDTYQLNLSQPFWAAREGAEARAPDHLELSRLAASTYLSLRTRAPATMGALIDAGAVYVVSNSPETLLRVDTRGGWSQPLAESMPIKGTRPRATDPAADRALAAALQRSEKDLAEHVMIVDLVRNDLGRVAVPGTVQAPVRPELVSLPTVHHLVSTVRCTLAPGWSLRELVRTMFPGGSITGAPKRRAVELIDVLEDGPREVYCGALVAMHPDGVDLNIPIRTALVARDGLSLRSGGGIVIDSDPEAEREETIAKARAFDHVAAAAEASRFPRKAR